MSVGKNLTKRSAAG